MPRAAGLKRALSCLFIAGFEAAPRGVWWGGLVGLPLGAYWCLTLPYGGGIVAGPAAVIVVPIVGASIAFHVGAAVGLHRAGYQWTILLVVALAAATVLTPYAVYENWQTRHTTYRP